MTESKLLIHIGLHKTGTSWLQENLFSGRLNELIPVDDSPKAFAGNFIYGRESYTSIFDFSKSEILAKYSEFLDSQDDLSGKCLVISDEDLSGNVWSGGAMSRRIADDLYNVFPDARILITIREQIDAVVSSFLHFRLSGGCASLEDYLTKGNEFQIPLFNPSFYEYWRIYDHYCNRFGEDRVMILPLELLRKDANEYVDKIFRFLCVEKTEDDWNTESVNSSNMKLFWLYDHFRFSGLIRKSRNFTGRTYIFGKRLRAPVSRLIEGIFRSLSSLVPICLARRRRNVIRKKTCEILRESGAIKKYGIGNYRLQKACDLPLDEYGYSIASGD